MSQVECGDCGTPLDDPTDLPVSDRKPCPSCGSLRRLVKLKLEGTLTLHSSLAYIHRGDRPGIHGSRLVERFTGDEQSADGS